jgi:hypothetical protein
MNVHYQLDVFHHSHFINIMKFRRDDSMLQIFEDFPVDQEDNQRHYQLPKAMRTVKIMQTIVHDDVTAYCDDSMKYDDWMALSCEYCDGYYSLDCCYYCWLLNLNSSWNYYCN